MILTGSNRSTSRKSCPSATLFIANLTVRPGVEFGRPWWGGDYPPEPWYGPGKVVVRSTGTVAICCQLHFDLSSMCFFLCFAGKCADWTCSCGRHYQANVGQMQVSLNLHNFLSYHDRVWVGLIEFLVNAITRKIAIYISNQRDVTVSRFLF
jgi:hypothetical protein